MVDPNQLRGPDLGSRAEAHGERELDEPIVDAVRAGDTVTILSLMSPPPPAVDIEFPAAADKLKKYHDSLATVASVRGIIGPREVPRLWERHILNCVAVAELMPEDASVVDIGSGAGLPGIPLAIVRPDLKITLVESALRRTTYLSEVVQELGLENVTVLRGRAESKDVVAVAGNSDVITSRAVAPLGRLAEWSLPLLRSGGHMLAMKGDSVAEEVERDAALVKKFGGRNAKVTEVAPSYVEEPTFIIDIAKK